MEAALVQHMSRRLGMGPGLSNPCRDTEQPRPRGRQGQQDRASPAEEDNSKSTANKHVSTHESLRGRSNPGPLFPGPSGTSTPAAGPGAGRCLRGPGAELLTPINTEKTHVLWLKHGGSLEDS